jgi:hypothetical protein
VDRESPARGSASDGRGRSPVALARRGLAALVLAPGRSAAVLLTVAPYAWLCHYVLGTALGLVGDPILGGDWLTLLFTAYGFVFPLALAHRTLRIGLQGLTRTRLMDAAALGWLTAFYFVWMLARESVAPTTSTAELYGPVLAGEQRALRWTAVATPVALVVAGLSVAPREGSELFRTPFRTALVTVPGVVTALVLLTRPGPGSLVWPVVAGAFVGTLLAGVFHLPAVATAVARAAFVGLSAVVWAVGAVLWLVVHRRRPPTGRLLLGHVTFGTTPEMRRDGATGEPPPEDGAASDGGDPPDE